MTKPLLIVTAVGSLAAGFAIGYKVAEKRISAQFEQRLEKETAGMREFYQVARKPYATPQEAAAALMTEEVPESETPTAETANNKVAYHKIVKTEYAPEDDPEEELAVEAEVGPRPEEVHQNVFVDGAPILISQEEFMENESEYVQGNLTYYKTDAVLADEKDDVIEDRDAVIGDNNLARFGDPRNGSSDPNIIHVRNPRLQMEFEVCLSENSYRREVLGIDEPLPKLPSGRERP